MAGCEKLYNPPAIASPGSYLVVEGVINIGADSTNIKLSRTVKLSSTTTVNPEKGAVVMVVSDQNNNFPLVETSAGNYTSPGLNLNNARKYRLSIKTTNGQQYLSDLVVASVTPPIDSIGFIVQSNGIQLYVNTHDPDNNTHYYRWAYAETWQFHSEYPSAWITNGKAIVPRTPDQLVYSCFANDASSDIVLGSSAKLAQDVIYQNPLTSVASTSEKLETKYSILVHQYALTSDAYNFWTNLKKNTEQLGSIFDAEPSTINGNIHNTNNTAEPVLGYISACVVQSKRIFISNTQLPSVWLPVYPYQCGEGPYYYAIPPLVGDNLIALNSTTIPTSAIIAPGSPNITGFLGADIECVDCTIRGTKTPPGFWK